MSATSYTCHAHNWIGCLTPCPMCAATATEPGRAFFDDPSDDIQLPNGPLSFVSAATVDNLTADLAEAVAERDAALKQIERALAILRAGSLTGWEARERALSILTEGQET